ncbi:MAG: hypothetical protein PUG55_00990 [Bacillales bacterium]|nr:hypothetical protein [Bacillales bacterium]
MKIVSQQLFIKIAYNYVAYKNYYNKYSSISFLTYEILAISH